ncbi:alkaline ceramidase [Glarea lozoyensis ATCC 20868]|uniref:Alkaline ceramidase n=1 Tax=Glarea lozoyensis (strain ATCC 20868 / MF5171) TaxID=1116229 RepID=S3E1L5_GLAL2|nr:alkaline ceramidase [Glarea lozoyensis ATCC 20868]EPE32368.1 alkaline ceramidase [Glarea lozoyensis ATCC 20868]
MPLKGLSFPYPPAREDGYWAPVTSTINWCEEDYYATIYSAEIVNTLTNLLFIALGAKGIRNCLKYKHDSVFLVAFLGYLLVGSGSFAFHSTLKYPMQLVDELSMIYTACLMCYATFSFSQSRTVRRVLGTSLLSLAVFITLYYHYLQDPVFHQNAFAIITAVVLFRSMYVMEVNLRPSLRAKYATPSQKLANTEQTKAQRVASEVRDRAILNEMWLLVAIGLSIFLGGFGIWALDNQYCSTIRVWRRKIGLPWGILLEGHGWWHLMTGFGSYFYLVWGIWLRHCLNERQDEYILSWPSYFSIPEVIPIKIVEGKTTNGVINGHTNGHTNGHLDREDRKSV